MVEASWLASQLTNDNNRIQLIDPRPVVRYLGGHIGRATTLPVGKLFDDGLQLLPPKKLEKIFGDAGVDSDHAVILYDQYDGQNAAMLAWTLEYLGHQDVRLLANFFETWLANGNEVFFKPVKALHGNFRSRPNPSIRADWSQLEKNHAKVRLIDFRSKDEYLGREKGDARPGHIPGALCIPWTELLGDNKRDRFFATRNTLEEVASAAGLKRDDQIVAYCRTGPRAAIGYYALKQLGFRNVSVYDGSFYDWAERRRLHVEG
jgi:thiosulfate/3-mercaptopyruvate sulfurtransferase